MAIGTNDHAKEIQKFSMDLDNWRPPFSLETGTDGTFGEVYELRLPNKELSSIYFTGWLSADMDYSVDDILNYLVKQMDIKNLVQEKEDQTKENSKVVK